MFLVNRNSMDPTLFCEVDEMIFEEFKFFLRTLHIEPYMIVSIGRSNTILAKEYGGIRKDVPVLIFFMKKISEEIYEKDYARIIHEWRELLNYHIYNCDEYASDDMEMICIDGEEYIMEQYVRNFKIDIVDFLNSRDVKPMNVYCSSEPAYNIIYRDETSYEQAKKEFSFITMCIKEHIMELIKEDFGMIENTLSVHFWNPLMSEYSEWRLASEK